MDNRMHRPLLGVGSKRPDEAPLIAGFEDHFSSVEIAEAQAWARAFCRARNMWAIERRRNGDGK